MSDPPPEEPPEEPPPEDEPEPEQPAADPVKDAAKWKAFARKHEAEAKKGAEAIKRLAQLEDASKSELEKATARAEQAEQRADQAELRALRLEVAQRKGLTPTQAKRLQGTTEEELEADADELLSAFKEASKGDGRTADRQPPKPRLRPGAVPDARPTERDPRKLAEQISRRGF